MNNNLDKIDEEDEKEVTSIYIYIALIGILS
jgi:hypothetical protein